MSPSPNAPIGIFDSGVGGLTVFQSLYEALPNETFLYLADTAYLPYGDKSPDLILERTRLNCQFLLTQGVKAIVIACNSASAIALDSLSEEVPLYGVITHSVAAARVASQTGKIGLIGTTATIASGAYQRAIAPLKLVTRACPLLVPLIEQNASDPSILESYLTPFHSVDTLILGCTHYPLIAPQIRALLPHATLIHSGPSLAHHLKKTLPAAATASPPQFYVTDAPERFSALCQTLLNWAPQKVQLAQNPTVSYTS